MSVPLDHVIQMQTALTVLEVIRVHVMKGMREMVLRVQVSSDGY